MSEDMQAILRCGQCNKPFDKQSTLKRHGYYCRSRRAGHTSRSRSCASCAKAKARCDNRQPECSRCLNKAIECHYPANSPKGRAPRIEHSNNVSTKQQRTAPSLVADSHSVEIHQEVSNDDIILDTALAATVPEFPNLGGEYLDWNDPNIDFAEFLNQQTNGEITQYPSRSSSLARQSKGSTDQTVQVQQAISSPKLSISTLQTYSIRSLIKRPKILTGTQRIANLMLHTLKSYPLMMMRHNTLPPFIHPDLISSNVGNSQMEPLTNCISLVHMIGSGVQGNRKLFWKNVRLECERLCEEYPSLNKWELLAAMQALSIYILIRLDEGETDHNNLGFLLIATVAIIAQQFACIDLTSNIESTLNIYDLEISWKDWIFEESRRRLCVVYRVVNMLVYFEPASMCELQTDLLIAPLPAYKQLWEARDEFIWKAESERGPEAQTSFGLAANGELVKLDEEQVYCSHGLLLYKNAANWEEWCSGMDGLGGLVMLAASLVA